MTPEEEAEFTSHGMPPLGQGGEPVVDEEPPEPPQEEPPETPEPPQGDEPPQEPEPPKPGDLGSRHRADGTFKSADEIAADKAAMEAQQQPEPPAQPKMVPHEALHQERQRSAQAIRAAQLATTRLNALLSAQGRQQPGHEPLPDINQDPAGYILALERRLSAFEDQRSAEAEHRNIDSALEQDEAIFAAQVPDYHEASDYFVRSRAQELLQFYPPDEAKQIMTDEARAIANQAWQRGMSAGQVVYQLAQARGYQSGLVAQPNNPPPVQPSRGVQPQAAVRAVRAGQQASRSLSGGSGSQATTEELNAQALLAMTDDEFEQYLKLGTKGANERFAQIG